MKAIAAELNLSETAFLTTRPPGQDFAVATDFHLRWFTPKVEVALCGHVRASMPGRRGRASVLTAHPFPSCVDCILARSYSLARSFSRARTHTLSYVCARCAVLVRTCREPSRRRRYCLMCWATTRGR